MNKISLSDLTPITFLQTFIIELMHASEQLGTEQSQQLIENIALTAGRFFEEVYRSSGKDNKKKPLNKGKRRFFPPRQATPLTLKA